MRFTLQIGDKEKSRLEFSRHWFTGAVQTLVDGQRVGYSSPFSHFSFTLKEYFEFLAGKTELHKVLIEKQRPLFLAGFRPQTYRVFVDGQLVHEQTGY